MAQDVHVNMDQVLCRSHMFHVVLGAGRSALMPFLALYLRLLGLSATQMGLVFGARAFMTMICTPAWTACAKRFNKKQLVLMVSLFMMIAMHLGLCLIPPTNQHIPLAFCQLGINNGSDDFGPMPISANRSEDVPSVITTPSVDITRMSSIIMTASVSTNREKGKENEISTSTTGSSTTASTRASTTTFTTKPTTSTASTTSTSSTTPTTPPPETDIKHTHSNKTVNTNKITSSGKPTDSLLTPDVVAFLKSAKLSPKDLDALTQNDLQEILSILEPDGKSRKRRNLLDSVRNKWEQIRGHFDLVAYQTFVLILVLFIVGELFAAPYEKLADDIWFEYLDILDALNHYGSHRIWQTMGFVIVPTMVAAAVDHTPCTLPFGVHHFYIHFFVFAILVGIAFMLALCYPVSQFKQTAKKSRLGKGIRVLCGDRRAFTMAMTMVVVGATSAVTSNFLFWRVQDLGGRELAMGVSIAAAAGAEFVVRLIGPGVVRHLRPVGSVCLGLLLLAGMLIFYSFLWMPWLVVAGELIHGIAITLLWTAVQTYPDFRINPFVMDRSAASLITALHVGIGFACGSMVSGMVYDKLGPTIMFQGAAGIVVLWGTVFLLVQLVGKKERKIRYAKLLQDDQDNDSDESTLYDDDWLEVAMKRDR